MMESNAFQRCEWILWIIKGHIGKKIKFKCELAGGENYCGELCNLYTETCVPNSNPLNRLIMINA